jgi:hypothetical protein
VRSNIPIFVIFYYFNLFSSENDPNLVYTQSLGVLQCSTRHLSFIKETTKDNLTNPESHLRLVRKYQSYALTYLNFNLDRVRHHVKNALHKVVSIFKILLLEDLERLVQTILDLPWESKSKSLALSSIAKEDVDLLLQTCPDLPAKVAQLLSDPTVESSATDLYENLLKTSSKNSKNEENWLNIWIQPLLRLESQTTSISVMRLLKLSMKLNKQVLTTIVQNSKNSLKLSLICLKLDKTNGGQEWRSFYENGLIKSISARHFDSSIRLQALDVIISSHSTREDFTNEDLDLIRDTLKLNMTIQAASDRQEMIVLMKKMTARIKSAMVSSSRTENLDAPKYTIFIQDVFKYLFKCFFEGSSFSRRSLALEVILDLAKTFDFIGDLLDFENAKVLVEIFHDCYETNKVLALKILHTFPMTSTHLDHPEYVQELLETTLELVKSHKPPDSVSSGYFAMYLSLSPLLIKNDFIKILISELERQVKIAQVDLCKAAIEAPMYGVLFCIRSILDQDPGEAISDELFKLGLTITSVTSSVLNNDSPEGHLPMDMEQVDSRVTAQLLLLCSWRTSKEISLLFGQVCRYVSQSLISEVSSFFTQQLSEIIHRGAFEQAYIGFCSLCSFMWQDIDDKKNQDILKELLEDTLNQLNLNEKEKFCATRRSAGIPFLIQAVVSTEPSGHNFKCLKTTLSRLIGFSGDDRLEVRLHAYNILRVLYRDSTLGEAVSPFVAEGLRVAILGFKATTWAVSYFYYYSRICFADFR